MAKDSYSKTNPPKGQSRPKLKLVASNPAPVCAFIPAKKVPPVSQASPPKERFSVKVTNKGCYLYEMLIQDPSHYLSCVLELEIEENSGPEEGGANGAVVCYFPAIDDSLLDEFIEGDEALYGMLIIQFQLKVLGQLLSFCAAHYASELIIYMDDGEAEKFGVYDDFLSHCGKTLTPRGEKIELAIPVGEETFNQWVEFMNKASQDFRMGLWREQSSNFVIRSYLKWDPSLPFFSLGGA